MNNNNIIYLNSNIQENNLLKIVNNINNDNNIHGLLIQSPLSIILIHQIYFQKLIIKKMLIVLILKI